MRGPDCENQGRAIGKRWQWVSHNEHLIVVLPLHLGDRSHTHRNCKTHRSVDAEGGLVLGEHAVPGAVLLVDDAGEAHANGGGVVDGDPLLDHRGLELVDAGFAECLGITSPSTCSTTAREKAAVSDSVHSQKRSWRTIASFDGMPAPRAPSPG